MKDKQFVHQGCTYRFTVARFILNGEIIEAAAAAQNPAMITKLLEMGAGVIERTQENPAPGTTPAPGAASALVQRILEVPIQTIIHPQTLPEQLLKQHVTDMATGSVQADAATSAWKEYHQKKLERKKLSSQIHKLVDDGATSEVLAEQYQRILMLQDEERRLYNRAQYIEKNGQAPEDQSAPQAETIEVLKLEKRRLTDLRCKLASKLKVAQAKKPEERKAHKLIEWQLELDQADAAYKVVETRINKQLGK